MQDTNALIEGLFDARFAKRRKKPAGWTGLESLETRSLLAASPLGPEQQVNPTTSLMEGATAIAAAASGDFIVVYQSKLPSATTSSIFARLYFSDGTPKGDEFVVNPTVIADASRPSVAADADGDFVVAWTDNGDINSDIFMRLFSADGTPTTGEFRVNEVTTGSQGHASVGMDKDGDFVVAWTQANEVDFRRFSSDGTPIGGQSKASDASAGAKDSLSFGSVGVAMDDNGDFVVGWAETKTSLVSTKFTASYSYPLYDDNGVATGKTKTVTYTYYADVDKLAYANVNAKRYNAAGTSQGALTVFTSSKIGTSVDDVVVAMDSQGDFTVGYQLGLYRLEADATYSNVYTQVNLGSEVWMRRYSASGTPGTAQRAINTAAPTFVSGIGIDIDNSGGVTLAWSTRSDGAVTTLKALRFDSASQPDGPSFDLNSTATGALAGPAVALLPSGNIVFGFESGTTLDTEVFIRRFEPSKANLSASFGDIKVGKSGSAFSSTLIPGDVVTMAVRVTNGPTSALAVNTTTNIAIYASPDHSFGSDILLGTLTNQKLNLAIGATATFNFTWTVGTNTPPGAYRLYALADSSNTTLEVTDDDNVADAGNDVNVGWSFGNIGGGRNAKLVLTDSDGSDVTYSIKGLGMGSLDVLGNLSISGTDSKSAVTVVAAKGKKKVAGDNGLSDLGTVNVNGSLASFTAKTTNVTSNFSVTGNVATIVMRNAGTSGAPHALTINDSGNTKKPVSLTVADANNYSIQSNAPLGKITANSWGGTSTWNINGAVATVSIKGVASMSLLASGNIKTVTVGQLFNARIFAGVSSSLTVLPASLGSFTGSNSIGSLTVAGIKGQSFAFINSLVAAQTITKISLKQVKFDSGTGPGSMGVAADTLKSYKRDTKSLSNVTAASDNDVNNTFRVQVV